MAVVFQVVSQLFMMRTPKIHFINLRKSSLPETDRERGKIVSIEVLVSLPEHVVNDIQSRVESLWKIV